MATITYPSGAVIRVKNLSWLRAHASEVDSLNVRTLGDNGAELTAYLCDPQWAAYHRHARVYRIHFASVGVLRVVLARWRSLAGVPIAWR